MTKASSRVVERTFDLLFTLDNPVLTTDVARQLGVHQTTAADALRVLYSNNLVDRTRVTTGTSGRRPWAYHLVEENAPAHVESSEPAKRDTNKNRPATLKTAKRGTMPDLVRAALSHYKPGGRGFTTATLHARVGRGSYETVRKAVTELVATGEIVQTGRHRGGSRVYAPAALNKHEVTDSVATSVDDLLNRRDELRSILSSSERELAELEIELDRVRARLA